MKTNQKEVYMAVASSNGQIGAFMTEPRSTMTIEGVLDDMGSDDVPVGLYKITFLDDQDGQPRRQYLATAFSALMDLNGISGACEIEDLFTRFFEEGFRAGKACAESSAGMEQSS